MTVISSFLSIHGRRDVGQGNVNILQHLHSDHSDMALVIKLFLNLLIQFYLNNVTNLHHYYLRTVRRQALQHGDHYSDHRLL